MCAVYDTVRFDPASLPEFQHEQPCISAVPSFMLSYEGGFIMDGNMRPDAEVGTFADIKYSQKTQRNARQAFED